MSKNFKLPLFKSKREIFFALSFLSVIFLLSLYFEYRSFETLKSKRFYTTKAFVLNQYIKKRKRREYFVLKLKSDEGYTFYTTNYEDLKNIKNRKIRITLITKKISFFDFLRGFYAPSFDIRLYPKENDIKSSLFDFITSQHQKEQFKELFSALFLAEPISKTLRQKVQFLGISHLIAISGFHLGVLFFIFYQIFGRIYRFFQDRYFPYRNRRLDLSIFTGVILFGYMYMLDFVPSLLRSFVMMCVGFFFYARGIRVVSFTTLFTTVLIILSLFPKLLFSIGFWFSVSGVFYIFLFLHYFKDLNPKVIFVLLNFWVFFMMIPIVHLFFPVFSFYQLLSPILSMLFVVFYPLELFLHGIGFGGVLDPFIEKLLDINGEIFYFQTDILYFVGFALLSIFSIFHRVFLVILSFSLLFYPVYIS